MQHTVVGRLANGEPVYELPKFPDTTTDNVVSTACGCAGAGEQPINLQLLLGDAVDLAEEFEEVAGRLHAQIQEIDSMPATAEYGVNVLAPQRQLLLRELAIASQGVIQLRALAGTAAHVLS